MWVIKCKGESYYVNHVECNVPWTTKESPGNNHTKGSIKIKNCLLIIDNDNVATINKLTILDKIRLRNQKLGITRIIFGYGGDMHRALKSNEFKHSPFKNVAGDCGTSFVVCDLLMPEEVTFAALKYNFRILKPNESYYQSYDSKDKYIEEILEDE